MTVESYNMLHLAVILRRDIHVSFFFNVKYRCYLFSITSAGYKSFHHKNEELDSYFQVALLDRFL